MITKRDVSNVCKDRHLAHGKSLESEAGDLMCLGNAIYDIKQVLNDLKSKQLDGYNDCIFNG